MLGFFSINFTITGMKYHRSLYQGSTVKCKTRTLKIQTGPVSIECCSPFLVALLIARALSYSNALLIIQKGIASSPQYRVNTA